MGEVCSGVNYGPRSDVRLTSVDPPIPDGLAAMPKTSGRVRLYETSGCVRRRWFQDCRGITRFGLRPPVLEQVAQASWGLVQFAARDGNQSAMRGQTDRMAIISSMVTTNGEAPMMTSSIRPRFRKPCTT
jgi:hypothetical protein